MALQLDAASNLVPACSGLPGSVTSLAFHPFSSLVVSYPLGQRYAASLCFSCSFVDPSPLSFSCSFYSPLTYACLTAAFCFSCLPIWISDRASPQQAFKDLTLQASILVSLPKDFLKGKEHVIQSLYRPHNYYELLHSVPGP